MNRITPLVVRDLATLIALAHDERLGSFPHLKPYLGSIRLAYRQYVSAKGSALNVQAVPLPLDVRTLLVGHYNDPPAALSYISDIRDYFEARTCPMCGSFHSGTLDHVLPKAEHAAFSVYSLNLVPACKCNTTRNDVSVGANPGQRVLHPYFDDCLKERLVSASFTELGPVPKIEVVVCAPTDHSDFAAISFHAQHVVRRTGVVGHLGRRWGQLMRRPSVVVPRMTKNPPSRDALLANISEELNRLDQLHGSANNWDSMFMSGLREDTVIDWLFLSLTREGRKDDAPLFWI